MPEEFNPFEVLFIQIADLLKLIEEKSKIPLDKSKITPDVYKKLKKIEKKVKAFEQLSADIVAMSQVSQEEVLKRLRGVSTELPTQGQQLLEKGAACNRKWRHLKAGYHSLQMKHR